MNQSVLYSAAEGGSLECLKYVSLCLLFSFLSSFIFLAFYIYIYILFMFYSCWINLYYPRYTIEKGCRWDKGVSYAAARKGHLHCLRYIFFFSF